MHPGTASDDPFALPHPDGDDNVARFGQPLHGWLDLSTAINPFTFPMPPLEPSVWRSLPQPSDDVILRQAAAGAYRAPDADLVAAAPGMRAILQMLPRLRPPSRVAVVGPAYDDHRHCWSLAGHQVDHYDDLAQCDRADVVVLGNPDGADGRRHDPDLLLDLADALGRRGGLLVLDESFVDATPDHSLAEHIRPGLLLLRSFGRFFGLAGLRLGFALAEPQMARLLRQAFGPWAVGGAALAVGRQALSDRSWIAATCDRLVHERAALDRLLIQAGMPPIGGTALFSLVNISRAWALYEFLGQQGIVTRPFVAAPRWLRIGLPGDDAGRRRLAGALMAWR